MVLGWFSKQWKYSCSATSGLLREKNSWGNHPHGFGCLWEFLHHFLVDKSWIITDPGWKMRTNWEYLKIWHFFLTMFHSQTSNPWILCPSEAAEASFRWEKIEKNGEEAKVASSKSVNSRILGLTRGIAFSSLSFKPINALNPASSLFMA